MHARARVCVCVYVCVDVGDATSTTSMNVVKVGLENLVGLELGVTLY